MDKGHTGDAMEGCDVVCSHSKSSEQNCSHHKQQGNQTIKMFTSITLHGPQNFHLVLLVIGMSVWILCHDAAKAEATHARLTEMSGNADIVVVVIDFGSLGGQAEEAHHGARLQGFWEKSQHV